MSKYKNIGFDPEEIEALRDECEELELTFVLVDEEEEDDMSDTGEYVRFQFIGKHEGQEVIYDTIMYSLRLHHSSMIYEQATEELRKSYPDYIPVEEREEGQKIKGMTAAQEEEAEQMLAEIMDLLEDEEEIKVKEHLEYDYEFEYGIGLDVALNVEEVSVEVIEKFITDFNANAVKLDPTLYSFQSEEEDED